MKLKFKDYWCQGGLRECVRKINEHKIFQLNSAIQIVQLVHCITNIIHYDIAFIHDIRNLP